MLHILTITSRFNLLDKIYETIPSHRDIRWHLAKSNLREPLKHDFVKNDPRVIVYEVDCLDTDRAAKRNALFELMQDGYFYMLDDDTIFLEETYRIYKEFSEKSFVGMIVGNQRLGKYFYMNRAEYPNVNPIKTSLDTGMVICHHSVLAQGIRYEPIGFYPMDHLFWSKCFAFYGKENTVLVKKDISMYNYFSPKIRMRKRLFGIPLKFDIENHFLAHLYNQGSKLINLFRRIFNIPKPRYNYSESNLNKSHLHKTN